MSRKNLYGLMTLILVAAFVFAFTACPNGTTGDSGGIDELKLSNLPPGFRTVWVHVYSRNTAPSTLEDYQDTISRSTGLDAFRTTENKSHFALVDMSGDIYMGSGNHLTIVTVDEVTARFKVVNFSGGSASVDWNTMTNVNTLRQGYIDIDNNLPPSPPSSGPRNMSGNVSISPSSASTGDELTAAYEFVGKPMFISVSLFTYTTKSFIISGSRPFPCC
ncbi:MAG: hypothetical protein LBH42_05180, partial [Treponema sp.]|nr:hypothetical protein [Treponema sp.]